MECDWAGCGREVHKEIVRKHGSNVTGQFCKIHYYKHTLTDPIIDRLSVLWKFSTVVIALTVFYLLLKDQGIIP